MFQEICAAVGQLIGTFHDESTNNHSALPTATTATATATATTISTTTGIQEDAENDQPEQRRTEPTDLHAAALQHPASESSHSIACNRSTSQDNHHRRTSSLASFSDQLHASWTNTDDPLFGERPVAVSRLSSNASQASTLVSASSFIGEDGLSSAIHDAARITNWDTVKDLCLQNPSAAKFIGKDRWTALHHACNRRCPREDVVEALLRAYPEALLLEEDKGWYPLHYACRFKAPKEVVRLLVDLFPDMGRTAVQKLDKKGRTPLYYAVRYDAPPGVVGMLLRIDASVVLEEDQNEDSTLALVWDSWAEKLEGKRTLVRIHGHDHNVSRRLNTQTKVLERWNNVQIFLKAAFGFAVDDEDETTQKTGRQWRMLHATAAIKCHMSLFQLASALYPEQAMEFDNHDLQGPVKIQGGWLTAKHLSALHLAASSLAHGDTGKSVLQILMHLNPSAVQIPDNKGSLPLHRIVENKAKSHWSRDGAKEIYEAHPSGIRSPDADGRLPLHRAATAWISQGEASQEATFARSVFSNLLELHPDAAALTDHFGQLPLHIAAKYASTWDSQLQSLVDQFPQAVRARTGIQLGNRLPLHIASSNPSAEPSLILKLVELHPRATSQADREGKLPLHLACEIGLSWKAIQAIQEAYPEAIRQSTPGGWNPLQLAATSHRASPELIANLVELNPESAQVADTRGRYALHLACISGKTWDGGLSDLFDANPDAIRSADTLGLLPFHLACFRYCQSTDTTNVETNQKHHRRHSSRVSMEAIQREQTIEATQANILFRLLKADPTIL